MNKYFDDLYMKDNTKNKLLKFWQNNKDINNFFRNFFYLAAEDKVDE